MADPHGLVVADAAARAVEFVGMPEAQLNLAHAVVVPRQRAQVELGRPPRSAPRCRTCATDPPARSPPTSGTPITLARRSSGHGDGYVYPHDEPEGWVEQQYRPDELAERYWKPTGRGADVDRRRSDRDEREPGVSGSEWVGGRSPRRCAWSRSSSSWWSIVRLDRAAKDLRQAALDFRAEAEPALAELREVGPHRRLRARPRRRHRLRRRARRRPRRRRLRPRLPHLHQPGGEGPRRRHRHPPRRPTPQGRQARARRQRRAEGVLMFKRVTWLGVGFTLGVGTTVVAARKARQQLDRYKPPALVDRVTTTISTRTTTLKDQVVAPSPTAARRQDREPSSAKKGLRRARPASASSSST